MDETASRIIAQLNLVPLPLEGGLFHQTYVSAEQIPLAGLPARYKTPKPFCTAIYYMLTADPWTYSSLHRLPSDEIYHFYLGDPVEMLLLEPGGAVHRVTLGQNILQGQQVQWVAPAGWWQASALLPGGRFALLGTTMAPGYTPDDFEPGDAAALTQEYPGEAASIRRLSAG